MTLEDITRLVDELNVMKETFPDHADYIERIKKDYHSKLKSIAIDYELKINAFYALITNNRSEC